jgi:hypothetical protein
VDELLYEWRDVYKGEKQMLSENKLKLNAWLSHEIIPGITDV